MLAHPSALLATKLFIPSARSGLIARGRLTGRLDRALELQQRLVLVSAPAGFGKTTLVSEWVSEKDKDGGMVAWVSLDDADNDPARFYAYFVAALASLLPEPELVTSLLAQLTAPSFTPESFGGQLLSVFASHSTQRQRILVLDDYHAIQTPALHHTLGEWLEHPPTHFTLLLTTRADPPLSLSRLRARGEMTELRSAELRFTSEEAAAFLNSVMGLNLSSQQIAMLDTRTEGWIAGLQLAALSMRGRDDVTGFLRAFTGSHRYIVEYLTDEVLQQQPEPVVQFLLTTCILDRLSAQVCNAVAERSDSQKMLEHLERSNLFVQPLDDVREWYRYHPLFADVLRNQALAKYGGNLIPLHLRAARIFDRLAMPEQAIEHAHAAADTEYAAHIAENYAQPLLNRGEYATVRGWLERLPDTARRNRPRLALASASIALLNHRLDETEAWLAAAEQAAARLEDGASRALAAEVAAMRAGIAINDNDLPRTIMLAQQALAGLPQDNVRVRGLVTFYLGLARTWNAERDESIRLFEQARRLSEQAGDINTALTALLNQGAARNIQGYLHQAFQLYGQLLELATSRNAGQMPIVALTYANLGYTLYEWNDLTAAAQHLEESIARGERLHTPRSLIFSYLFSARLAQTLGNTARALELMDKAGVLIAIHNLPQLYASEFNAYRVRLWLEQDNVKAASDWAQAGTLDPDGELDYLHEAEYIGLARVLAARGRCGEALVLLDRLRRASESSGQNESVIKLLALEAVMQSAVKDTPRALATLERALVMAMPEGYVRTFADEGEPMHTLLTAIRTKPALAPALVAYADRLLTAFPSPRGEGAIPAVLKPSSPLPTGELLTEREREILVHIAAGWTNPEISRHLHVEISTVKKHINNLFSKLGVKTRTQAIVRARSIGLIA